MSAFSVQLKVALDANQSGLKDEIPPMMCDGFEFIPDKTSLPIDELRLSSIHDLLPFLSNQDPITAKRILLDLRGFTEVYPRFLIYFSPLLYRWRGNELCVILPEQQHFHLALPAIADLLRSLEMRSKGIRLISCPTCARCRTDFPEMVRSIEEQLARMNKPLDVAVMGCEVNGPGEARAADIGIAFGDQKGMLFKNGEKIRVVSIEEAADVLIRELETM
ncbi:MAG: hypothetical protein C4527_23980 [Candidatus Omnitrophota bacterium]|jgi:hypothetical protein|nr:MAG: hypothetical protein C4527_23980 [Candidatus Omnitrophota bacterium]